MFTKDQIDTIVNTINLKNFINKYIDLKKIGQNYRGFSPFNSEKNPSFMVSNKKKIWKDFSSGKGGNIITFIMEYKRISFIETIKYLIFKYNINITNNNYNYNYFNTKNYKINNELLNINNISNIYFKNNLKKNKKKYNYLINKRKINKKIIYKFELGSFNYNTIKLIKFLEKNINPNNKNLLFNNGFLLKKNNTILNLFINSIIFPIHNKLGYIIGFGAKKFNSNIKYINSYKNPLFEKNKILYGLYFSYKYIIKTKYCILTEGYMDLLSLYKKNIKNVVATLGINLSKYQLKQIKNLTKKIIIIYDGDKAGILGTKNIIKILLKNNFIIKVFLLKNNNDIDQYILLNKNKNIKKEIKTKSINFLYFLLKIYHYKKKKIYNKYYIIKKIIIFINYCKSYINKYLYLQKISKILNINIYILYKELINLNYKNKILLYNNTTYLKNNISDLNKNNFFLEKFILKFLLIYSIRYYIFNKNKKQYNYMKYFFLKQKLIFLNKKYNNIYKYIFNKKKCLYIIYNLKLIKHFIKNNFLYEYKIYYKKKFNSQIFNIYKKYKIHIINQKIKKIKSQKYNNNLTNKILKLIKKRINLQKIKNI
ncbi:MAG: DNA primase [Candidatus Shikimatogenerans sp. AspAUS03]|uniref:DNA primase n=1 Tax=Candidatus Shikimatogenerans sp. AspAUS03 TaxID=3158563 RepID=A0AAU7QSZ1_9FLAO